MDDDLAARWSLDPHVDFLNHGSFGACPLEVQAEQARLRTELEQQPLRFPVDRLGERLAEARAVLGAFLGADADDLAFVTNATEGVNTVLAGVPLEPGDEVLVPDHAQRRWSSRSSAWCPSWPRGGSIRSSTAPTPRACWRSI